MRMSENAVEVGSSKELQHERRPECLSSINIVHILKNVCVAIQKCLGKLLLISVSIASKKINHDR